MLQRNKKSETQGLAFLPYYIIIAVMFLGFLTGSFSVARLTDDKINEYDQSIKASLNQDAGFKDAFKVSLAKNAADTLVLWAFGLTVFGSIPLFVMAYCRGYALGFTLTFLAVRYKFTGVAAITAGVLPHTFLYLAAFVLLSGCALKFSHRLLNDRRKLKTNFISYCISTAVIFALFALGAAVEGYISCRFFCAVLSVK